MIHVLCNRIANVALPALLLAATGCAVLSGPDCINEYRGVSAAAHLIDLTAASADTGRAFISLSHERNARTKRTASRGVVYFASSTLPRESVTAVHVHATANDALLYSFPLTPIGPDFVITQNFTNEPYPASGAVAFDDIFEKIDRGQAYVDVHTGTVGSRLRGVLVNEHPGTSGWQHAYCS